MPELSSPDVGARSAREWMLVLMPYCQPNRTRSIIEILITVGPLIGLWLLAWAALSISPWLTLALTVPAAGFLVRLFLIQHDCGHGAFFRKKATNDWVGRVIGVFTLTPYDVWRRSHAIHHASTGNLDERGFGDITTLTVREFEALPWWHRMRYRIYRHPFILFVVGPAVVFLINNRLPLGFMRSGWQYWASAMITNLGIAIVIAALIYCVGVGPFLWVHLPIVLLASSIGVWLFYIQHQFEDTVWEETPDWQYHDAAFYGSSYYVLPQPLRWFTANIGMHHLHHLCARIPYYRLPAVLRDYPELGDIQRMTLIESLATIRLRLWDESQKKLVTFKEARQTLRLNPELTPAPAPSAGMQTNST